MMHIKTILAALLALLALQSPLPAWSRERAAPAPRLVHARPALWVVKDADTTIYLFGTVHLMKPQIVWFEGKVRGAYARSDELAMEVVDDEGGTAARLMLAAAADPQGPPLSSLLSPELRTKYLAILAAAGVPPAAFEQTKPWFASVMLSLLPLQKLGYDPRRGVDAQLKAAARADGKRLTGLETSAQQIGFFESLTRAQQTDLLIQTVKEHDEVGRTIDRMVGAWSAGDPVALAATLNESLDETPDVAKVLLFDRNQRWADWVKARLDRSGTVFLAVGAGHLAGKGSLREALAARGIASRLVRGR